MITVNGKELRNLEEQVQYLTSIITAGGGFKVDAFVPALSSITSPVEKNIYGVGTVGNYTYFEYLNGSFYNLGTFKGPAGDTGATGLTGEAGATGAQGVMGLKGTQGPRGLGWSSLTELSTENYSITTSDLGNGTTLVTTSAKAVSGLDETIIGTVKYVIPDTTGINLDTPLTVTQVQNVGFDITYDGGNELCLPITGDEGIIADVNSTGDGIVLEPDFTLIQNKLISGSNIRTINNTSILGSGNITISGGGGALYKHSFYDNDYNQLSYVNSNQNSDQGVNILANFPSGMNKEINITGILYGIGCLQRTGQYSNDVAYVSTDGSVYVVNSVINSSTVETITEV